MNSITEVASFLKNVFFVSPSEGATVYSPCLFKRRDADKKIDEVELCNLISQAVWQLFDEQRMRLSRRFDISELDIVLADTRVLSVRLDGSKVLNPLGFSAEIIEVYLAATLIKRPTLRNTTSLPLKKEEVVLVFEPNAAYARQLQDKLKGKRFILAAVEEEITHFYIAEPSGRIIYLDNFGWGEKNLIAGVKELFVLGEEAARDMVYRYLGDQTSLYYFKRFKPHFGRSLTEFVYGVSATLHNNKMTEAPVVVSGRLLGHSKKHHWQLAGNRLRLRFVEFGDRETLAKQEFQLLARHEDLNRFTRQRIRWLMSSMNK